MNILITGGCGFIASNFINHLCEKYPQYNIYNIDALYYCADEKNVLPYKNYKFIKGNINSVDLVNHVLNEYNITHILHFAAQSHVDNSFSTPLQYTQDNILGTHNLLECVRQYGKIELFIHVSTDEVYGESQLDEEAKNEMSIMCPTNPYAASKGGAELIVNAYLHSFKLPIIITRGNNVYGPRQYPEKLIPKFIQLLKENKNCTIHGDGKALRSFLYITDVCKAFDIVFHKGRIGEIYNIGTKIEYSVLWITKLLVKLIKKEDKIDKYVLYVNDREFNDKRYFVNNDKLKALGWEPTIGIEEGLLKTIDWFENLK